MKEKVYTTHLCVRVDKMTKAAIDEIAQTLGVTTSEAIRRMALMAQRVLDEDYKR